MANRPALQIAVATTLAAVLLAGAARVEALREARYPTPLIPDDSLYITSGGAMRRLTLAYQALAADVYWIRAIQYYGGTRRQLGTPQQVATGTAPTGASSARRDYALLYPLLDLTTSLDPRFTIAYRFGAIFLAEPYPGGPGRADLAVKLLEKGLREQPTKWEYMEDIGFVYYWWRHDFESAASWFHRAGRLPGAPNWLEPLAAATLMRGGDRRASRLMWQAIRQSADVDWLRQQADWRLAQLDALDEMDTLQPFVDRFARAHGGPPADWMPLVRAGELRGVPLDPSGVPFVIENGRATVSRESSLFPLPTEPDKIRGNSS
ncbi:MAG: tetratricopeptide repeat protein [Betaproteobacteria bacterium]